MADITLSDLRFETPQAPGIEFPVSVSVENNETVAPIFNREALCSNGVAAPDGHRVEVTFEVVTSSGQTVAEETTEVCATVEQPSNALGDTRAETNISVPSSGDYNVRAEARVIGASGSASAQPKHLEVGEDESAAPGGDEDADETTGDITNPFTGDEGLNIDIPDPDGSGGGLFGDLLGDDFQLILVLVIIIIALGALS